MPRKYDPTGIYGGDAWPAVCVKWIVSNNDTDFSEASSVQHGFALSTIDVRFAIKVEATGLAPYTKYFYRFESCEGADFGHSPVGIFKTLPDENDSVTELNLAFFSCANLPFGFFNAYGHVANNSESYDYVQHIVRHLNPPSLLSCSSSVIKYHQGDYIYEYKNGDYGDGTAIHRIPEPDRELSSLQDYRDRFAQYRLDKDLQELHRVLAWQVVWDDHDVADNAWAHGTADSNDTMRGQVGDYQFSGRKANAVIAYFEWMPIRQVDTDDKLRIWRTFKLGNLADMVIEAESGSPDRTMTGPAQEKWFLDQMSESSERGAAWRLVMQQVVFSRVNYSIVTNGATEFNMDAWEGYRYQRDLILQHIENNKINNTVILSGDSHASWVSDLKRENSTTYNATTGSGALGVEFAGSAVSSPSSCAGYTDELYIEIAEGLVEATPSLQYAEGQLRGFVSLSITPSNVTAEYFGFYDQLSRNSNATLMGRFTTQRDSNKLDRPLNGGKNVTFGYLGAGKA
ncbi:alkaline phosphatase D, partial [Phenoliferia sp. Uapishka_3]